MFFSVITNLSRPSSSTSLVEAVNAFNQQEESATNDTTYKENQTTDAFSQHEDSVINESLAEDEIQRDSLDLDNNDGAD